MVQTQLDDEGNLNGDRAESIKKNSDLKLGSKNTTLKTETLITFGNLKTFRRNFVNITCHVIIIA